MTVIREAVLLIAAQGRVKLCINRYKRDLFKQPRMLVMAAFKDDYTVGDPHVVTF